MAQATTIWHNGLVNGTPAVVGSIVPSLQDSLNTTFQGTYQASTAKRLTVMGTDQAPVAVALDSVAKARFVGLRVVNGSLKMLLTTPSGSDQAVRVSGLFLWHSPNAGDEITAIKLVGTADIELLIAGDLS